MSRGGSLSELIVPKLEFPNVVLGLLKCAWLKMLKKSASSRSFRFSRRVLSFAIEKSLLLIPGPRTWPTPPFPKVYAGGAAKQPVSNHLPTNLGVATLVHVMLAELLPPLLFNKLLATVIHSG